jgi:hypothetical protein
MAQSIYIEIVDLPIDSMVVFHSYVTVYQRLITHIKFIQICHFMTIKIHETIGSPNQLS